VVFPVGLIILKVLNASLLVFIVNWTVGHAIKAFTLAINPLIAKISSILYRNHNSTHHLQPLQHIIHSFKKIIGTWQFGLLRIRKLKLDN